MTRHPTRREFIKGAAALAGASAIGSRVPALASVNLSRQMGKLAAPVAGRLGIDHIVVVMMENRSFDHLLGWLPGANGIGVSPGGHVTDPSRYDRFTYKDRSGKRHGIYHAESTNGCGQQDQDHGYPGGRLQWDGGRMDGFVTDPSNSTFSLSYYLAGQRPFMSQLALNYTTCDNYFCSILGPTYPNRFFMHSAQTDRIENTTTTSTVPTIWDQLNQSGGPTGRYYFSDIPFLALWGTKYLSIAGTFPEFLVDCEAGNLPNVSYIDPRFEDEGSGTSGDDHPLADLKAGDAFLSEVFHAVANSPVWDRTMLVINYDEWGGFFDHVPPPYLAPGNQYVDTVDVLRTRKGAISGVLGGFRVPCIIASPYTRGNPSRPRIVSDMFDHTSILALIESNWRLHPMTPRDASANSRTASSRALTNLASALSFHHPNASIPNIPELAPFISSGCDLPGFAAGGPTIGGETLPSPVGGPSTPPPGRDWAELRSSGLLRGWA